MELVQLCRPEQNADSSSLNLALPAREADGRLAPQAMNASELMYYYGAPLAHVVEYEDRLRMSRCEKIVRVGTRNRRAPLFGLDPASPVTAQATADRPGRP